MNLGEFIARGQRAQAAVDAATPPGAVYARAFEFIARHPGTSSAAGMAKLVLSLWNGEDCGFSFRECINTFDDERLSLALDLVEYFAVRGETAELVDVGHRVHALYPKLWELGVAAREAKAELRRQWEEQFERELAAAEEAELARAMRNDEGPL